MVKRLLIYLALIVLGVAAFVSFFVAREGPHSMPAVVTQPLAVPKAVPPLPARVLRVVVDQRYENADRTFLPFTSAVKRMLEPSGVTVVGADAGQFDGTIFITARGRALGTTYATSPLGSVRWTGVQYSGAVLTGTIRLELPNRQPEERKFQARADPPAHIERPFNKPSDLSFQDAFFQDGSFAPVLVEMLAAGYGSQILVAAALDDPYISVFGDWSKGPEELPRLAAETLGKRDDAEAIDSLVAGLEPRGLDADLNPDRRRRMAITALGNTRNPRAVAPLLREMSRRPPGVVAGSFNDLRVDAARALGAAGDPSAVEPLIQALDDPRLRETAIKSLGQIGDERAIEPLIAVLKEKSEAAPAAQRALDQITKSKPGDGRFTAEQWQNWWDREKQNRLVSK